MIEEVKCCKCGKHLYDLDHDNQKILNSCGSWSWSGGKDYCHECSMKGEKDD